MKSVITAFSFASLTSINVAVVAFCLITPSPPAHASELPLSSSMLLIKNDIKSCLDTPSCADKINDVLVSERRLDHMVAKFVKTNPRQMQYGYDVKNMFSTLKRGLANKDFPKEVFALLMGKYINDVEARTDVLMTTPPAAE